ncbi:MAG: Ger(x)C family spore germination protein [Bacilli bacterium]|nr:Ger(x)C family spore germination protein [Bacilli bacterium]MDD4733947.1 Ger(x)C family spore germination protein [Bacilli bacterium]
MKLYKLFVVLMLMCLNTGCWNYRELDQVSIVQAIGVDKIDDSYSISVQVLNTSTLNTNSSSSSVSESPFTVYEAIGNTIDEALERILYVCPKQLYLGQMNLLAISEEVAKEGIINIFDFFMRNIEVRKIFPIVIVKGDNAIEALKVIPPIETINSLNTKSIIETNKKITGLTGNVLFDEVLMCYYIEGRNMTITAIEIIKPKQNSGDLDNLKEAEDSSKIKVIGVASFLKDKIVGYLEDNHSIVLNLLKNKSKRVTVTFPCDKNGYGTLIFNKIEAKVIPELKNNKPSSKVKINGEATVTEYNCKIDLNKKENINKIEKMAEKELKKNIDETINIMQKELKSDIVGFGESFYRNKNKYWKKVENKWDEIFPSIKITSDAKIKIYRISTAIKQVQEGR